MVAERPVDGVDVEAVVREEALVFGYEGRQRELG